MQLILIRHGEPDYSPCDQRGFTGFGRDLAPLTKSGIAQAQAVSSDPVLRGAELILSSPYTRALQTAAIISKNTGIDLTVETDLHEWLPDLTYTYRYQDLQALHDDSYACRGEYPPGQTRRWEAISAVTARIRPIFLHYEQAGYQKIIAVSHGGVIRRFTGQFDVAYCSPYIIEFTPAFSFFGWIDE